MKLFLITFAVIAAVAADVSHLPSNDYLPPVQSAPVQAPVEEYIPPVQSPPIEAAPAHELADDGYRYKTQRRVVFRQRRRRDVSHLPSNDYLPPVQESAPSSEYLPPVQSAPVQSAPVYSAPAQVSVEAEPAHELANDGYRYKTQRRVVFRQRRRRDVSHLPSNDYLPPVQESAPSSEYLPPVQSAPVQSAPVYSAPAQVSVEAEPAHELANDGYRYKTQRRVVFRQRRRRDVSHLPSNDYLPPVQESAPSSEYLPPVQSAPVQSAPVYSAPAQVSVEAEPAHELADDGYRYKTHRRRVFRRRH